MFKENEPFKEPELNHMALFLAHIAQKFKSGNDIDVERITLTRQVGKDFSTWIKDRIEQYNFLENQDFICSPRFGE